jgi:hypothetical protein
MKPFVYILLVLHFSGCTRNSKSLQDKSEIVSVSVKEKSNESHSSSLMTIADAEKIMGETMHLTDSVTENKVGVIIKRLQYSSVEINKKTTRPNIIECMIEYYDEISAAENTYISIKKANEDHDGIKTLTGIGDEAYFHSDNKNFYFVLARKCSTVFRMKVNRITDKTSLPVFNAFTESAVAAM